MGLPFGVVGYANASKALVAYFILRGEFPSLPFFSFFSDTQLTNHLAYSRRVLYARPVHLAFPHFGAKLQLCLARLMAWATLSPRHAVVRTAPPLIVHYFWVGTIMHTLLIGANAIIISVSTARTTPNWSLLSNIFFYP